VQPVPHGLQNIVKAVRLAAERMVTPSGATKIRAR
jgi:hypothetical protein